MCVGDTVFKQQLNNGDILEASFFRPFFPPSAWPNLRNLWSSETGKNEAIG